MEACPARVVSFISQDSKVWDSIDGLNERYVLDAVLGHGGMGTVHKAYDTKLKRNVALKFVTIQKERSLERFKREAAALAKLTHPHIAQIYDFDQTADGRYYIAMQLVEGGPIDQVKMPMVELIQSMKALADALEYAHANGVIHRDIKPSNILKTPTSAYLTDFGLAKLLEGSETITQSEELVGSPAFMSPEQLNGIAADGRTDIYSLGITFYYLATGKFPFEGDSAAEIITKVLHFTPPAPTELNPEVPAPFEAILQRCIQKNRDKRYATAQELSRDLAAFLRGEVSTLKANIIQDSSKQCWSCGHKTEAQAHFCEMCGKEMLPNLRCKSCGDSVMPTWKFCRACGAQLVSKTPRWLKAFTLLADLVMLGMVIGMNCTMLVQANHFRLFERWDKDFQSAILVLWLLITLMQPFVILIRTGLLRAPYPQIWVHSISMGVSAVFAVAMMAISGLSDFYVSLSLLCLVSVTTGLLAHRLFKRRSLAIQR